jgi:hypothetical protein
MAATYDPTLATDADYVRFLVPDTDVTPATDAQFSDEEIAAVIAEEQSNGRTGASTKYFVAAVLLGILRSKFATLGEGRRRKIVDELEVEYGQHDSADEALEHRIDDLNAKGRRLLHPRPRLFKAYGSVDTTAA